MWVFLHSGHNHSESAEAAQNTSSVVGPELLVLVAIALVVVSLVGVYVTKRYL
mgnify:CR=1 FL=1|jgi:uncharacterized membrane protein SpoIIM required for sporulation